MPTNLPPEYYAAEKDFRDAHSIEERIRTLEELISTIPKHKGTDKLRAEYRRKLSKLKSSAQAARRTGKHHSQFNIEWEGSGRIVVVGTANTGKSSLVAAVTHAHPDISDAPFTSWAPTPGMMEHEGVQLQLIDTPPIDRPFVEPEFIELIKSADVLLVIIDLLANPIEQFQRSVALLNQYGIYSPNQRDIPAERRTFRIPMLVVVNKDDDARLDEDFAVLDELLHGEWALIPISVTAGRNLDRLMKAVVNFMRLIRVYSKPPGKDPDLTKPYILKEGSTVDQFALMVHHDFHDALKSARVWGHGVHDGQMVGRDHRLYDGDIVELHM